MNYFSSFNINFFFQLFRIISITKDNDYLKESIRESKSKINELLRVK